LPDRFGHLQMVRHNGLNRGNKIFELGIGCLGSLRFESIKHLLVVCHYDVAVRMRAHLIG
jgi:hypothetical protein